MKPCLKYSPVIADPPPPMREDSKEYQSYWREEIRRCQEGYKPPGGVWIPGSYYRHLNHRPIKRRRYKEFDPGPYSKKKIISYALYRDLDHELHHKIYELRKEGKRIGAILLKGRRKGASDDITSIVEHELLFNTEAECFYATPDLEALSKIKEKFATALSTVNPQMTQPFTVENVDARKLGMEVDSPWGKRTLGSESILYTSQIPKPSIWKGGAFSLGVTDEIGTFGKKVTMSAYWGDTKDCFVEGDVIIGFHIFLGTVDQISYSKNTDLENYWSFAEAFNFEQILIPAQMQYGDYWDIETGISDQEGALKKIFAVRAPLMEMDDKTSYYKEVQNNPTNKGELFLLTMNSKVDVKAINDQIERIAINPQLKAIAKTGSLTWERESIGKEYRFTGRVFFIEQPGGLWVKTYDPINHLYPDADITAVDDYFKDDAPESDSEGGIVVWRRFINNNEICRIPILTYLGRPPKLDDFHDEALKGAVYTQSRAAVEFHNKMLKEYFLKSKKVNGRDYLKIFPRVNGKVVSEADAYGYNIKDQKELIAERLKLWTQSPHIENCFDIRFLKNIALFGKANSDLGSAAGVAICYEEDMSGVPIKKEGDEEDKNESILGVHYSFNDMGIPIQVYTRSQGERKMFRKMSWMNTQNKAS